MAVHSGGRGPGHVSRKVGGAGDGIVVGALATPTLTNFSALGTAPLVLSWSDNDYTAGMYGQLQVDQTSNAFGSLTQNIVFFIDGNSWARLDEAIGLATPSGLYFSRIRAVRENESGATTVTGNDPVAGAVSFLADVSAWSNTFTDTIVASAAVFNTVNGTNKSHWNTVSGSPALTVTGFGAGLNFKQMVRTTIEQANNKAQFEVTITASATDEFYVGVEDGTINCDTPGNQAPGADTSTGICVRFAGGNDIQVVYSSYGTFVQLTTAASSILVGDVFTIVFDKVGHTLELWRTRSGSTVQIGSTVSSLPVLTHYYAYVAMKNDMAGTYNFGGTTYAKTPGSGVALIWA